MAVSTAPKPLWTIKLAGITFGVCRLIQYDVYYLLESTTRMADFVNYKKRSISLPPGCKDLMDVLQPGGLRRPDDVAGPDLSRAISRGQAFKGKLSDIGNHVEKAYKSRALAFTLSVTPPDERITLNLETGLGHRASAFILVKQNTAQDTAMREFFIQHGQPLPDSTPVEPLLPGVLTQVIYSISQLPSESDMLSILVENLFREVCGLNETSDLCFRYDELVNPD